MENENIERVKVMSYYKYEKKKNSLILIIKIYGDL